ncbi:MAG: DUF1835 domain-containing protein [Alistipes sp.]|nr:DUF1835 domain-containing protein [Alistipes sp.]
MSRLHLVYGEAGAGTLRRALSMESRADCVVAFPAVLNYAPLFPTFDDAEIEEYAACCGEILHISDEDIDKLYSDILSFVKCDFSAYDEVVVWRGTSAGDRVFYDMVCSLVSVPLSEVDLSPLRDMLPNPNVGALSMSLCSVDNLIALQERVQPIDAEQKLVAAKRWTEWSKLEAALRVLNESGEIVEVEEEVYDDAILALCRGEWVKAPIVVGRLLCDVDFGVGDSFLHHRLISLARCGRLQVRPNAKCFNGEECIVERYALPHIVDGVDLGELRLFEVKS